MSALIVVVIWMTACGSNAGQAVTGKNAGGETNATRNMNQSTAKNVEVRTDIEGLEKLIKLPVRPSEVKWTAEVMDNSKGSVPGPSDYRLVAVLKYDGETAEKLAGEAGTDPTAKFVGNADVKPWFPDEVKSVAKTTDGRTSLEGTRYSAAKFANPPYNNGSLVRVGETNYFVLNLFSF